MAPNFSLASSFEWKSRPQPLFTIDRFHPPFPFRYYRNPSHFLLSLRLINCLLMKNGYCNHFIPFRMNILMKCTILHSLCKDICKDNELGQITNEYRKELTQLALQIQPKHEFNAQKRESADMDKDNQKRFLNVIGETGSHIPSSNILNDIFTTMVNEAVKDSPGHRAKMIISEMNLQTTLNRKDCAPFGTNIIFTPIGVGIPSPLSSGNNKRAQSDHPIPNFCRPIWSMQNE